MSQESQYPCKPLDRELSCIRLLTLRQGECSSIECDLEVYPISSCPAFTALSYVWGEPEVGHEILLNGKEFRIRSNLYDALQAILYQRSKTTDKLPSSDANIDQPVTWEYFWIDAICIDQDNILERNHQVGLMKQIYSNANFVLAWLGKASTEEESEIMEFAAGNPESWGEDEMCRVLNLQYRLYKRDYWTRIWIVQEIILAQNVLIMCGNQTLKWEVVDSWAFWKSSYTENTALGSRLPLGGGYRIVLLTRVILGKQRRGGNLSLAALLIWLYRQECSDPRDRVYGLLGMLKSPFSVELEVDYSLTQEQLFERTIIYLARYEDSEYARLRKEIKEVLEAGLQVSKDFGDACFAKYVPSVD